MSEIDCIISSIFQASHVIFFRADVVITDPAVSIDSKMDTRKMNRIDRHVNLRNFQAIKKICSGFITLVN